MERGTQEGRRWEGNRDAVEANVSMRAANVWEEGGTRYPKQPYPTIHLAYYQESNLSGDVLVAYQSVECGSPDLAKHSIAHI